MEMVFLLIGLAIGALLGWLLAKSKNMGSANQQVLQDSLDAIKVELAEVSSERNFLAAEKSRLQEELSGSRNKEMEVNAAWHIAQTDLKNVNQKLEENKQQLTQLQQQFTKDFELVANKILEEKTQKFTDQNKTSLDQIIAPLKEKIKDFEERVQKVYDVEAAERNMLKGEIKQLIGLNQQMHTEAQNLTKALKGDTKTQGNWGEVILERILEKSGLTKGSEYHTQVSTQTDDGKRLQPDVLINLPEGKCLVIDAKVSLLAYEKFVSAETEAEKLIAIKEHIQSIKNHIKGLGEKNYQNLYGVKSLDFVLLFMPIEPAFALAVQHDGQLFNDAFDRNIVIVSPTTLLATLRTVANIWRQEQQSKNAIEIANKAGDMYDKFVGFVDDLITVGNKIKDVQKAYEGSMNKLSTGTGNLVKRSEELKKLGAKTAKSIIPALIEKSETIN